MSPLLPGSPLVTLVVASYNHADFLEQRMDSLIHQSYPHLEILVIDDCSTDDSRQVLEKYRNHPKVQLIWREANGGWVEVSNQGVLLAKGKYVIFANCDDYCDLTLVEALVEVAERNPSVGLTFSRSKLVDENGTFLTTDFEQREARFRLACESSRLIPGPKMTRYLLHSCVIPNLSAAAIRRDCFDTVGLLSKDYRVCCDWDLFFRIFEKFDAYYVAQPLNDFRQHGTTIRSSTKQRVIFEEYFRLLYLRIAVSGLTWSERQRFKTRIGTLWAEHLVAPSWSGLSNFGYHLSQNLKRDAFCLFYLALGVVLRIGGIVVRAPKWTRK